MQRLRIVIFCNLLVFSLGLSNAGDSGVLVTEKSGDWRFTTESQTDDWTAAAFNADSWTRGQAPLGFGEPELVTMTTAPDAAGRVPITTYFRKLFDAENRANTETLRLKIRVDDGFVAYLNGVEIVRWNVPTGVVTSQTLASEPLSAPEERLYLQFDVPAASICSGENVLAVEVHQINNQSSDLFLDAQLSWCLTTRSGLVQAPQNAIELSLRYNSMHTIPAKTVIPDGFLDGGREMQIDEFGYAVAEREILRVDRVRDVRLQKHLEFARSAELAKLSLIDRATRIAKYVDAAMTPSEGRDSCVARSELLATRYGGKEILIGDVVDLCGAGVCRHRALLLMLMANEAALNCTLVRGNYGTRQDMIGHTWNELLLNDGTQFIVDAMNHQPDFYLPAVTESSLTRYLTVAGAAKY